MAIVNILSIQQIKSKVFTRKLELPLKTQLQFTYSMILCLPMARAHFTMAGQLLIKFCTIRFRYYYYGLSLDIPVYCYFRLALGYYSEYGPSERMYMIFLYLIV